VRRWNGWGTAETPEERLGEQVLRYLRSSLGELTPSEDATLAEVLRSVPDSSLPPHPLVGIGAEIRLRHARGQSLPDWVALRTGRIGPFPDGVCAPTTEGDIRLLLEYAGEAGAALIPYGGGTSVVGHINPTGGDRPTLTMSMRGFNRLRSLDGISHLAVLEAGMTGPEIEANLNREGFTLGHFPQSFEFSTLGGWIATRSTGSQSQYYGRIEDLFAGGHLETPGGPFDLPPFPASAAGPDLRQLVLGSEGRLGIVTHAAMRVSPFPPEERFYGVFLPSFDAGLAVARQVTQARVPISMLRLSDAVETETSLILLDRPDLTRWLGRGLKMLGLGAQPCMVVLGLTGHAPICRAAYRLVRHLVRSHNGILIKPIIGNAWHASRFKTPYLRNSLWKAGVGLDTLETALPYTGYLNAFTNIKEAIRRAAEAQQEQVLAFGHCSHSYPDGGNAYITFLFRHFRDPERTLELWRAMKLAASQAIVAHGGTISHQHGVGLDHRSYLPQEKGQMGMHSLAAIRESFDPRRVLNPGKLIDDQVAE
jgi:alkyldihydroxyacetonephosphate synthase